MSFLLFRIFPGMKNPALWPAGFFLALFFGMDCALSAPAVPVPPPASISPVLARIGIAAAIKGTVKIHSPGQIVGNLVSSGEPIYPGDEVVTGPGSNLQILLLDETVFTIGPDSSMVIDHFVFDPETHKGQVKARIVKGVFRFVSGKIARKKPGDMTVDLPSGTIGIRGTIVMGEAHGKNATAILMGPGEKNNAGQRIGSFILTGGSDENKKQTEVTRSGYGVLITEAGVGSAFRVPASEIQRMSGMLEPATLPAASSNQQGASSGAGGNTATGAVAGSGSSEPAGSERSPTRAAGQERAAATGALNDAGRLGNIFQRLGQESNDAAQSGSSQTQRVADGIATFEHLRRIQTGRFRWTQTGIPLFNNSSQIGVYNLVFDIHFGNRMVAGSPSTVTGYINNTANTFGFALSAQSFDSGDQPAVFQYRNLSSTAGNCGSNCKADVTITLNNQGGAVAPSAAHSVSVADSTSGSITGSGSSVANSRQGI